MHTKLECEYFRSKGLFWSETGEGYDFDLFWFSMWDKMRIYCPLKVDQILKLHCSKQQGDKFTLIQKLGIEKARAANVKVQAFSDRTLANIIDVCRTKALTYRAEYGQDHK